MENQFFKPTPLYKEFMILDLVSKDANITQRALSACLHVSVSMINAYLNEYEKKGYIKRKYLSTKTVEYFVTKKGSERKRLLNLNYLHNTQALYNSAKHNIQLFMKKLENDGIKKLVIYGAGEVANIILNMMYTENLFDTFEVLIIDDSNEKIGLTLYDVPIESFSSIFNLNYDAILIGSYTYREEMVKKLNSAKVANIKIISFFNY